MIWQVKNKMVLRETEHFVLEVREVFDAYNNFRPRYIIRNKVTNVDEVTMDLLHIVDEGLEKLEEATYPTQIDEAELDQLMAELENDPTPVEPTIN